MNNNAVLYAEKYGIVDYTVTENKLIYFVKAFDGQWITYKCIVDLFSMEEVKREIAA